MNEESKPSIIDPQLEARIIALVLGEASDFECEELNRLIAEKPELAEFKRQMQHVHGLLAEVGQSEFDSPSDDWKLPPEKRNAVLAVIRGEAVSRPATAEHSSSVENQKAATQRNWKWNLGHVAVAACVLGFMGILALPSFMGEDSASEYFSEKAKDQEPRAIVLRNDRTSSMGVNLYSADRITEPISQDALSHFDRRSPAEGLSEIQKTLSGKFNIPVDTSGNGIVDEVSNELEESRRATGEPIAGAAIAGMVIRPSAEQGRDLFNFDGKFLSKSGPKEDELSIANQAGGDFGGDLSFGRSAANENSWKELEEPSFADRKKVHDLPLLIAQNDWPRGFNQQGGAQASRESYWELFRESEALGEVRDRNELEKAKSDDEDFGRLKQSRSHFDWIEQPGQQGLLFGDRIQELPAESMMNDLEELDGISNGQLALDVPLAPRLFRNEESEPGASLGPNSGKDLITDRTGGAGVDSLSSDPLPFARPSSPSPSPSPSPSLDRTLAEQPGSQRSHSSEQGAGISGEATISRGFGDGELRGIGLDDNDNYDDDVNGRWGLGTTPSRFGNRDGNGSRQGQEGEDQAESGQRDNSQGNGQSGQFFDKSRSELGSIEKKHIEQLKKHIEHKPEELTEEFKLPRADVEPLKENQAIPLSAQPVEEKDRNERLRGNSDKFHDGQRFQSRDKEKSLFREQTGPGGGGFGGGAFSGLGGGGGGRGDIGRSFLGGDSPTAGPVSTDGRFGLNTEGRQEKSEAQAQKSLLPLEPSSLGIFSLDARRGRTTRDALTPEDRQGAGEKSKEGKQTGGQESGLGGEKLTGTDKDAGLAPRFSEKPSVRSRSLGANKMGKPSDDRGFEFAPFAPPNSAAKAKELDGKRDRDGDEVIPMTEREMLQQQIAEISDLRSELRIPAKPIAASAGLNEVSASENAFSTFSLHVSDVSFKLAFAALAKGEWPKAAKIRIEEFVNAFDYGDPTPRQGEKVACQIEQSVHPFLQQRNLLRVSMKTAAAGRTSATPLRLTFLIDNSGSMERADRQQMVRQAFQLLAKQLNAKDQVTLISFARQPRLLADSISGANANKLVQAVSTLPSEGGTNIEAALQLAFEKAKEHHAANAQNRIILLTDGAVNLGNADPESLSRMVSSMRSSGIAFDAAGISADGLNDEVLEALTRKGDGRYYLLDSVESADDDFAKQIAGALRPSAKNVKVQIEFNPQRVGRYKLLGYEKHILKKEDFRNDKVDAAEMAAAEAGIAMYQFEALPDGEGDVGSVSVRFQDMATGQMVESRWPIPYQANAARIDQATPSLRIATSAAMLAAKLRSEVLGQSVDLKTLSQIMSSLPEENNQVKQVQQLRLMIEQARQLNGQ